MTLANRNSHRFCIRMLSLPLLASLALAQAPDPEDLDFRDGAATIPDRETFVRLSYQGNAGRDAYLNGVQFVKFNLEGDTMWTRSIGDEDAEEGYGVFETMDGGVILSGISISATDGDTGAFLAKLDAEGTTQWWHVYGEDNVPEVAFDVYQGEDEHFTFGGVACGDNDDAWLVQILPFPSGIATPKPMRASLADRVVPNPFSSRASISYQLSRASRVSLAVYDLLGQEVRSLASGIREAGTHEAAWNGTDASGSRVADGLYFVRLEAGDQTYTTKVLLER